MQKPRRTLLTYVRKLLRIEAHIDSVRAAAYVWLSCSRLREGPMSNSRAYPSWSPIYVSAVLETDPRKLPQRIQEAHQAIEGRLSQAPRLDAAEQRALAHARNALAALKSQRPS
jgi:hypothetical protein